METDEQEALSRKYGNDALIVLRLKSGRLAVFDNSRQLRTIVDESNLLDVLSNTASTTTVSTMIDIDQFLEEEE
jgi:hypothetical protein